jgi:uncharacterized membrane protein
MNQRQDLASAVMERDRSRSRIRLVTVTVGAASLATAGVVAYHLPGPAPSTAVNGATTTPAAQQPSAANQEPGEDGGGEDGGGEDGGGEDGGAITVPGGAFGQGPAQAVSGGS